MNILLFPPIAFILILAFVYILFKIITPPPAYGAKSAIHKASQAGGGVTPTETIVSDSKIETGKFKPYACGEEASGEKAIPDYQQFFPFAIFFTLLHVAGLIIATWAFNPIAAGIGPIIAYIVSVLVILAVLFAE